MARGRIKSIHLKRKYAYVSVEGCKKPLKFLIKEIQSFLSVCILTYRDEWNYLDLYVTDLMGKPFKPEGPLPQLLKLIPRFNIKVK